MDDQRPDGKGKDAGPSATAGTYTLLVELPITATIEVGALGERAFEAGWYAYTGSALGSGGFARVDRHRELAAGERDTRHWHIDYLLGYPDAAVDAVVRTAGADVECRVSRAVDGDRVPGFGASDCDCESHLVYNDRRGALLSSIAQAHEAARDD